MPRQITYQVAIPAALADVWQAWTSEEGATTFFAPECRIELKVGGAYEMFFDLGAPPGQRGGEGLTILALQPQYLLSFTWNAPPSLPDVRGQHTHVTIYFEGSEAEQTTLTLIHDGWGEGGEWDQAFEYFTRAWGEIVLPRLEYRFKHGPINWNSPPALGRSQK